MKIGYTKYEVLATLNYLYEKNPTQELLGELNKVKRDIEEDKVNE